MRLRRRDALDGFNNGIYQLSRAAGPLRCPPKFLGKPRARIAIEYELA